MGGRAGLNFIVLALGSRGLGSGLIFGARSTVEGVGAGAGGLGSGAGVGAEVVVV